MNGLMTRILSIALLPGCMSLTACIGKNSVGFVTVDNLGVNITPTPQPTVGISYDRTEVALAPTFENGNVPSVAAAVWHDVRGLTKFGHDGVAIFAGSNAANYAAGLDRSPKPEDEPAAQVSARAGVPPPKVQSTDDILRDKFKAGLTSVACVSEIPAFLKADANTLAAQQYGVFAFGTRTGIGFRVTVPTSPATAPFANLHLGYNRVEAAVAPVMVRENGCVLLDEDGKYIRDSNKKPIGEVHTPHAIYSPSYLAIISEQHNAESTATDITKLGSGVGQVFAAGKAAEVVSQQDQVHGSIARMGSRFVDNQSPIAPRKLLLNAYVNLISEDDAARKTGEKRIPKIAAALNRTKKDANGKDVADPSVEGVQQAIKTAESHEEVDAIQKAIASVFAAK